MKFQEWVAIKKLKKGKKRPSILNPNIDSFLRSVDNLKKDVEELEKVSDKKAKETPKPVEKPKPEEKKPTDKVTDKVPGKEKEKPIDEKPSFKSYADERDEEETPEDDEIEDAGS